MIRIQQIKLKPGYTQQELEAKAAGILRLPSSALQSCTVVRRSVDARKKPDVRYICTVDVKTEQEERVLGRIRNAQVSRAQETAYHFPTRLFQYDSDSERESARPVIVGTGPAGLFCGYLLAKHGFCPLLLERGGAVEERTREVEAFWNGGALNPETNVQFGEGGAGTFSDGKLNTLVKDKDGRNREVLRIFVENGAPESILYENRPHIGTDILVTVVRNMRRTIERCGGEVRFHSRVSGLMREGGHLIGVTVNDKERLFCKRLVLATGHSARDVFELLERENIPMEAKAFAVGLRVEHTQQFINETQYGERQPAHLPPASYKVAAQTKGGRGVYSFCMCPGGYVVNASSEEGRLAVNGMSYSDRSGRCANSAVIVSVTPEDFAGDGPLAGIAFQRRLEEKAFAVGGGCIPVERYGDFCREDAMSSEAMQQRPEAQNPLPSEEPCTKGAYRYARVRDIMPEELNQAFQEGMEQFERVMPGFAAESTLVCGIESRTSSPVRILRNRELQSSLAGLYPCGEGAGYAGGITSAAMDGMRVAERLAADMSGQAATDGMRVAERLAADMSGQAATDGRRVAERIGARQDRERSDRMNTARRTRERKQEEG